MFHSLFPIARTCFKCTGSMCLAVFSHPVQSPAKTAQIHFRHRMPCLYQSFDIGIRQPVRIAQPGSGTHQHKHVSLTSLMHVFNHRRKRALCRFLVFPEAMDNRPTPKQTSSSEQRTLKKLSSFHLFYKLKVTLTLPRPRAAASPEGSSMRPIRV